MHLMIVIYFEQLRNALYSVYKLQISTELLADYPRYVYGVAFLHCVFSSWHLRLSCTYSFTTFATTNHIPLSM